MKIQIGLYMQSETTQELKEKAVSAGVSIGDLADLYIRFGMAKLSDDALKKWASELPNVKGRHGGGLTKNEKAVLASFTALKSPKEPGAFRFNAHVVAQAAGMSHAHALWALRQLEGRGMVSGYIDEEQGEDRFGRPKKSIWCLTEDKKAFDERNRAALAAKAG